MRYNYASVSGYYLIIWNKEESNFKGKQSKLLELRAI